LVNEKVEKSKEIMREAFEKFRSNELAVTWSGGKDSTTDLWILLQVHLEDKIDLPKVISIEEGDSFPEIITFIDKQKKEWNLDHEYICNTDVLKAADHKLGNIVNVEDLNERNQKELERISFKEDKFVFEPESPVCNHLMKTVPLNQFIENNNIKGIFVAIRWDEQRDRELDEYFSKREGSYLQPEHWRIEPILHFRERDIWNTIFEFNIPHCTLYKLGYRSLGVKSTTKKFSDLPAWEQDLENTDERGGRFQDKEKVMDRLRRLGYM